MRRLQRYLVSPDLPPKIFGLRFNDHECHTYPPVAHKMCVIEVEDARVFIACATQLFGYYIDTYMSEHDTAEYRRGFTVFSHYCDRFTYKRGYYGRYDYSRKQKTRNRRIIERSIEENDGTLEEIVEEFAGFFCAGKLN